MNNSLLNNNSLYFFYDEVKEALNDSERTIKESAIAETLTLVIETDKKGENISGVIMLITKFFVEIIFTRRSVNRAIYAIGFVVEFLVCMKLISFFITGMVGMVIAGIIVGIIGVLNLLFVCGFKNSKENSQENM